MELVITRQALQFLQSILLGISAGALYDILRPFRALLPRLTGVLDFLYGLILTFTAFAFLLRPADGELRGFMLLGITGGLILFYGLLSRPLRPVWRFWAVSVAEAVKISLTPLVLLKVFLKKSVRGGKNLFYFAEKCYTIKSAFRGGRAARIRRAGNSAGKRAGKPVGKTGGRVGNSVGKRAGRPTDKTGGRAGRSAGVRAGNPGRPTGKTGGVGNGAKKKQNGTKAASCQRRGDRAGVSDSHCHGLAFKRTAGAVGDRQV